MWPWRKQHAPHPSSEAVAAVQRASSKLDAQRQRWPDVDRQYDALAAGLERNQFTPRIEAAFLLAAKRREAAQ